MAKQPLTLKSNVKDYIKYLERQHGGMAKVASSTVNTGAKVVNSEYKKELKKFTLRNKFTMGAIQIYYSRPKSRGGDFREIKDINAVVGVKKLRGKDHYLKKQEFGDTKRGTFKTKGKVALPMDKNARTSGMHNKPVKGALQLQKSGGIQTLKIGGEKLGYNDRFNARGGAQRWAILYRGMREKKWDLSKQFFFEGMKGGLGIFKQVGKKFKKTRGLEKSAVQTKATHKLQKSTEKLTPTMMTAIFKRNTQKYMRGKK